MPLKEIPYRLNQFFRKKVDKYFPPDNLCNPININSKETMWDQFENKKSSALELKSTGRELDTLLKEADSAVKHKFDILVAAPR